MNFSVASVAKRYRPTDADLEIDRFVFQLPADHRSFKQRRKQQERSSRKRFHLRIDNISLRLSLIIFVNFLRQWNT